MTFHSGFKATATVNGTEVPLKKWNVTPKNDKVEFKNSKTGVFAEKEVTYADCTFSFEIDYDFDANPFAAPLALGIRQTLTNVKLFLDGSAGTNFWLFPSAIVMETPQSAETVGVNTTQISCENSGTFSYPGGYTPS